MPRWIVHLALATIPAAGVGLAAEPGTPAAAVTTSLSPATAIPAAVAPAAAAPKVQWPIPPKIRRYAERLVRQYDTNGDGKLQADEWAKMQGNPRLIDTDRDTIITANDVAMHVYRYSLYHKIHLAAAATTLAADVSAASAGAPADSAMAPSGAIPPSAIPPDGAAAPGDPSAQSDGAMYGGEGQSSLAGDASPSGAKRLVPVSPWLQKFHVSPKNLPPGLPDWFIARDLDGDGQVTLYEFAPEATRKDIEEFSRYDLDHDGVITVKEALRFGTRAAASAAAVPPVPVKTGP